MTLVIGELNTSSSIRGRIVNELKHNSLSIFLSVDHFSVIVISNVENADSHMYEDFRYYIRSVLIYGEHAKI